MPAADAQVKLSDKKSEAYKRSRKNKKNKQKEREKKYKNAQKRNLEAGEIDIVPEMLKEQYVPKDQNAEKNPSKQIFLSYQKQSRSYTKKAKEALDQGLVSKNRIKTQQRKYNKQRKAIARHQGSIRVSPAQVRDNRGMFPQPPVEQNPGRANIRIRNKKLSAYALKSEEMSMQGLIIKPAPGRVKRQQLRTSKKIGLNQGNLTYNKRQNDATYMAKSVEGLSQGLKKSLTSRELKQQKMSNSLIQSQYQGQIRFKGSKQKDLGYIEKSAKNQKTGLTYPLNQRQKSNNYMAKSVEGLSQGLVIRKNRNKIESQRIRKSKQAMDQGMISSKTVRQKEADYMAKSVEGLNQGLKKSLTFREQKQQWMSNSLTQSQYQGQIRFKSSKQKDLGYIEKSMRNQKTGLAYPFNVRQKSNTYMAKSVEGLSQGLVKRKNVNTQESQYIRKSKEAMDQGMISRKSTKQKEAQYMGKSVELLNQGMIVRKSTNQKESQYIRKSKEAMDQGMISSKSTKQKEAQYMGKSVELLNQGLTFRQSINEKESRYIRKSIESLNQGLYRGTSRKEKELMYAIKSIQAQKVGLVKVQRQKAQEAELRDVSREVQNYKGDEKVRTDFIKDWMDKRKQAKYVFYTGNFKVKSRLFENIENRRMAARRAKFDGMDQESKFEQWWASLWKKPVDQRKKPVPLRKPRYDSKEHEIWFY